MIKMFSIFEQEKIASIAMFACMACSLLIRVVLGLIYIHLIHQADNMASTRCKQLKQCKLKFANCYQLNHGMPNVPVFVDKFISRMSLGPFSLEMLGHLSGQLMLLAVVSSGIGVCRRIVAGSMLGQILPFYIVSLLGLYLYFSISTIVDLKGKRRILKINLVDYLENHLAGRMEVTQEDMEMLYGPQGTGRGKGRGKGDKESPYPAASRRNARKGVDVIPVGIRGTDVAKAVPEPDTAEEQRMGQAAQRRTAAQESESKFTASQQQELEQLLKEFLTS